jgi:hypothetical protein
MDLRYKAKEILPLAQQAILDNHGWLQRWSPNPICPPCQFGDIMEQVPSGCYNEDDVFECRLYYINQAWFQLSQHCRTHDSMCPTNRAVDVDLSGLPCTDNSRAKMGRQFLEGPTGQVYAVHAKKHSLLKTKLIILENVEDKDLAGLFRA